MLVVVKTKTHVMMVAPLDYARSLDYRACQVGCTRLTYNNEDKFRNDTAQAVLGSACHKM